MIDLLELKILFDASLVESVNERHTLLGFEYENLDIPMGAKSIHWREDGTIGTSCLYHPYESLPTSFTGMAFKVHLDGYFFPHITLKASPAKILQGHNVFGFDDMQLAVEEMLYQLQESYPVLYGLLAIETTSIVKMDITYLAHLDNPKQVKTFIDYMSRVSNGHTKPTKNKKFETTCYWGGANSRLLRQKCYAKWDEYQAQLDEYIKKSRQGDAHATKIVQVMSNQKLQDYAKNSIRWECTLMSRWLERNGYPVNVWEFIKLEHRTDKLYPNLWIKGFSKIIDALKGQTMKYVNDEEVLKKLKSVHFRQLESGKISYRKTINLYGFYNQLKAMGYAELKDQKLYSRRRFNELIADLVLCGFSKSYLQNLHIVDNETKVIPMIEFININFGKQVPDWYIKPISTPQRVAMQNVANQSYVKGA